jgi:CRP-like cAMP-binding protein
MFELLHKKISTLISINDDELNFCKTLFLPKKLRKRQYLLQEGDVCRYQAFVEKGALRSYRIDEKGTEHILQFALEGWWVTDLSSHLTGDASCFSIQALEDSELLLLSRPSWDSLMQRIPSFEHYFRIIIQNHLIATQKRVMQSHTETAEEMYLKFVQTYPEHIQRIPQHMIASYLGVSRETLSRLRKSLASHH